MGTSTGLPQSIIYRILCLLNGVVTSMMYWTGDGLRSRSKDSKMGREERKEGCTVPISSESR